MTTDEAIVLTQMDAAIKAIGIVLLYPKAYGAASFHDLHGMVSILKEIQQEITSGGALWV